MLQYPFSAEHGEDAWLVNFLFWEKRNGFYLEVVSGVYGHPSQSAIGFPVLGAWGN